MKEKVDREEHESFGMLRICRMTGGGRLFGSHLDNHRDKIQIVVSTAYRQHSLSRDRFFRDQELIELEMSPVQFAQAITTLNHGDGIPCTLKFVTGKGEIEPVPETHESEQVKVLKRFRSQVWELTSSIEGRQEELDRILSKKTLTKKDRERISWIFAELFKWFSSSAPFILKQFEESAERVVSAAKSQVEEFVTSTLIRAGMEKLAEGFELPRSFGQVQQLPGDVVDVVEWGITER